MKLVRPTRGEVPSKDPTLAPVQVRLFTIHGDPRPQGDKSAVKTARGFRVIEGNNPQQRERLRSWRGSIDDAVRELVALPDRPLWLRVVFRFHMPQSRPRDVRARGWCWKSGTPDLDKLLRGLGDGLVQAGKIVDDSRIVDIHAIKIECVPPAWTGAYVAIGTHEPWSFNMERFHLEMEAEHLFEPQAGRRFHQVKPKTSAGLYVSYEDGVLHHVDS